MLRSGRHISLGKMTGEIEEKHSTVCAFLILFPL